MEDATMEAEGSLLSKILPPRLEDAGLEDCALPPHSIREAFFRAVAYSVRSRAEDESDTSEGDCVNDPWPTTGDSSDSLIGVTPESELPEACSVEKGGELPEVVGDDVSAGVNEEEVAEEGKGCLDGLQGLKIGDKDQH